MKPFGPLLGVAAAIVVSACSHSDGDEPSVQKTQAAAFGFGSRCVDVDQEWNVLTCPAGYSAVSPDVNTPTQSIGCSPR